MRSALRFGCAALLIAASAPASAAGETPLGRWLAPDAGQHTMSTIELYLEGDELAGRVVGVVDRHGRPLAGKCADCPGELRDQPIVGMRFLWGLHEQNGRWTGGRVIDLRDGVTQGVIAHADLEVDGDRLTLHAYLGMRALGQSRTWQRAGVAPVDAPR
jgi:uncharacterized protein (DUF2147 family)